MAKIYQIERKGDTARVYRYTLTDEGELVRTTVWSVPVTDPDVEREVWSLWGAPEGAFGV